MGPSKISHHPLREFLWYKKYIIFLKIILGHTILSNNEVILDSCFLSYLSASHLAIKKGIHRFFKKVRIFYTIANRIIYHWK